MNCFFFAKIKIMIAEVIVEVSNSEVDKIFDYIIPKNILEDIIGCRVKVPFGKRVVEGFVMNVKQASNYKREGLKKIITVLGNEKVILPEMIELAKFMKEKYNLKTVDCLKLFIPNKMKGEKDNHKTTNQYVLAEDYKNNLHKVKRNSKKQQEIISFLENNNILESNKIKDFSASALKTLQNFGIVLKKRIISFRQPMQKFCLKQNKFQELTELQKKARDSVGEDGVYLIHGVTGSGKTEVYMQIINREINKNKTAIMLVPEISLTPQVLKLFKERFGEKVAIIHSGLSDGERYDEWFRLYSGDAQIAIGARSAIFAPLKNIGVIIIDEEHDGSYVSENNPRYNTFEIAKFRSEFNSCSLILGSATPSIETYYKVEIGEIKLIELPTRINGKNLPEIEIVDMLGEIRSGNTSPFSRKLLMCLENCFKEKKQAILFLNRRGYTSFMMCKECGYVAKCSDCDVSLVYHKIDNRLICHYCGKKFQALTKCPECGSKSIKEGAIGTENIVEQLKKIFPKVPIYRMDNDTTRTKNAHQKILNSFSNSKPGLLVGTQMVAKGHDFPDVILVGIIDADQSLYQSHYKSPERTFSLITQVSGRAGRSESEGKVILQTYSPKKYVYNFAANYNYKGFYKKEINLRKATRFPPFSTILRIMFSGEDEDQVLVQTKQCFEEILNVKKIFPNSFIYLDVIKPSISKIKKKYRFEILMRLDNENVEKIIKLVYNACDSFKTRNVQCFVEINPLSIN